MSETNELLNKLAPVSVGMVEGEEEEEVYQSAPPSQTNPYRSRPDYSRTPARPMRTGKSLSELFLRYSPERDSNFLVSVSRTFPQTSAGTSGFLDEFVQPINEAYIKQRWGGGRYEVVIKGSHPKTHEPGHICESLTVNIAGPPKDDDSDNSSRRTSTNIFTGSSYPRRYQPQYGQQPYQQQQQGQDASTLMAQTLRDVLASSTSGKDAMINQLRELISKPGHSGLNPETVQQLVDSHEMHKSAMQSRYESQLAEQREQYTRDIERSTRRLEQQLEDERAARNRNEEDARRREDNQRERYEREIAQLQQKLEEERKDSQRLLDRMETQYKDSLRRAEELHKDEVSRLRYDLEKRVEHAERAKDEAIRQIERSKDDALKLESERSKMLIDKVTDDARRQMDMLTRQSEETKAHLEQLRDMGVNAEKTRADSLADQLRFQLNFESEGRRKAEEDARRYQHKAEMQEDPVQQLTKYKSLVDTLGSFFGAEETSIIPAGDVKDNSLWGRVERLANTRFGQRAGEVVGAVAGSTFQRLAASGQAASPQMSRSMPAGLPPQMPQQQQQMPPQMPRQMPQQPMPSSGADVQAQLAEALYGSEGRPQRPTRPQPMPQQQQPQSPVGVPEEALARVKEWVNSVEEHIELNTDPAIIASKLNTDLPPFAVAGLIQNPIEGIVAEIVQFVPENRGIITSEKGIEYLKKVQEVVRQAQAQVVEL